ncbi:penicillin-binding protein activator [Stappia indica]|uniref:penicillin-binding protein activator n=1 Tax=Stappia indica TaxID=538381 RepID=UPI001CD2F81D|nr:penicillin-binding protein activator [Stappia indica]MCA1299610.1 penicillin-binding protein activator [Stappia indica]
MLGIFDVMRGAAAKARLGSLGAMLAGAVALTGCMGSSLGEYPGYPSTPDGQPATTGETLGTGTVRVGLLLPMSGGGSASSIATVFRNTAELALSDFQGADIQILVKDTAGTAAGGKAAAQAAISEGAELLLGPVFAPAVGGAGSVARASGVPIVAFSSDEAVASRGIYLLSFLPRGDVQRIVTYAASQRKRSFAALLPDDTYGAVVEAAFRQEVGRAGARIVTIERYKVQGGDTTDIAEKARRIAANASQIDAVFVPAGNVAPFVAQTLTTSGVNLATTKMLGSGQWEATQVLNAPPLSGAWYPGPDGAGFKAFAERYRAVHGSAPPRNASLAYDATILAAGLVRSAGASRFSERVLTNRDGFLGIDGVFRFNRDGLNQRGLAIYEVTGSGSRVIAPAPRSFGSGS